MIARVWGAAQSARRVPSGDLWVFCELLSLVHERSCYQCECCQSRWLLAGRCNRVVTHVTGYGHVWMHLAVVLS